VGDSGDEAFSSEKRGSKGVVFQRGEKKSPELASSGIGGWARHTAEERSPVRSNGGSEFQKLKGRASPTEEAHSALAGERGTSLEGAK